MVQTLIATGQSVKLEEHLYILQLRHLNPIRAHGTAKGVNHMVGADEFVLVYRITVYNITRTRLTTYDKL